MKVLAVAIAVVATVLGLVLSGLLGLAAGPLTIAIAAAIFGLSLLHRRST
jgi:ABC-type Mn2+/Zn2+ transport system permease subunit